MPPPVIINPLTGSPNEPASWQRTTWQTPSYSQPQINYGASGVQPAGGMNLTSLDNYINSLNRQGQSAALTARIPGGPQLEATSSGNIASELRGEVDPSTIRLLQQQAAERGVATGAGPASDNTNAAYLQALGLTSLQLQEQGQRDLSAAEARNPAAPLYDPSTQLLTPYQSAQIQLEQERLAQSGGGGGNGYAAPRVSYAGDTGGTGYAPVSSTTPLPYVGPTDPTATWLQSIGYTDTGFPGARGIAGEQGRTTFDYGGYQVPGVISPGTPAEQNPTMFDYGNVQVPGAISPATPAQEAPLNYADIFGPDLTTLYGPAVGDLGPTGG